ncbi:hypothetical protein AJ87_02155 [Rhizobium yanglingense]|nr:hypothetical protein AJ87_02155 [Rhizobium yanglingense]
MTIVSSDKDLMQLVTPNVHMYDSMKDKQIGIPDVIEKWGVPPEKMIDLQAMTGDSVDNVPGIPGIGPKTAAQLLAEYGDLDTLLDRAHEIKQEKRRQAILEMPTRQGSRANWFGCDLMCRWCLVWTTSFSKCRTARS